MTNISINQKIINLLMENQDIEYGDFQAKLTPTKSRDHFIGVRTPVMRKLAKDMFRDPDIDSFMESLPHFYYEENNMHAFVLEQYKDFDKVIKLLNAFLPYVDNWATCDSMKPKVFKKNTDKLMPYIKEWIGTKDDWTKPENTYRIRFGIEMIMNFYLDEHFKPEYLDLVAIVRSEEYYVNMMIAWFFATALAKQWDATIPYMENHALDAWTNNKTIQKARESYRITPEQKEYLRTLKM